MAASSAHMAARHQHLTRAAQSAGEAFACPVQDDAGRSSALTPTLMWIAAGLVVLAAFLTAL